MEELEKLYRRDLLFNLKDDMTRLGYTQEDIKKVREIIEKDEVMPKFILNSQICIFLNHSNHNHEAAAKILHNLYKCKKEMKAILSNRDPDAPDMLQCFQNQNIFFAPTLPNGCNVVFASIVNPDTSTYSFEATNKYFIMTCETQFLLNGSYSDSIYIFNFENVKFGHIIRTGLHAIRNCLQFLEESTCVTIKAVHVLNATHLMKFVFELISPFTRTGILSKFHLHTSDMDWEEFYKNHVPKSHLPSDYGGDLPPIQKLHQKNREIMLQFKSYFNAEERQVHGEFDHLAEEAKVASW